MDSLTPTTTSDTRGAVLDQPGKTLQARLSLAGVGLLVLVIWILQRPYRGLNPDAVIYSFLALARLHPTSLAHAGQLHGFQPAL